MSAVYLPTKLKSDVMIVTFFLDVMIMMFQTLWMYMVFMTKKAVWLRLEAAPSFRPFFNRKLVYQTHILAFTQA